MMRRREREGGGAGDGVQENNQKREKGMKIKRGGDRQIKGREVDWNSNC